MPAKGTPIPIRFDEDVAQRIDAAVKRLKTDRAQLVRMLVEFWLDDFEKYGEAVLPVNWREIVQGGRGAAGQQPVGSKEEAERLIERNLQLQKKLAGRLRHSAGNGPKQ